MALSEDKLREYMKRLLKSRMRLLCSNGFYGLLLMHMIFSIDVNCRTAATNGTRIFFGPDFLEKLTDDELDFVLMHEILHVVLEHCTRGKDKEDKRFNIAADIVVNSNIIESIGGINKTAAFFNLGEPMHLAPNGDEGFKHTAEEIYKMLPAMKDGKSNDPDGSNAVYGLSDSSGSGSRWDDHSRWGTSEEGELLKDLWVKRFEDACEAIQVRDPDNSRGMLPAFARRMLLELKKPQTDWRTILNEFVQEEIADYSFNPPDKRFDESPFFLPDFNDTEAVAKNILFMIDTSGSMSDDMITAAFSEVKGAIDQYNGKLKGWLGFFDAAIIEPIPFSDMSGFTAIKPAGGGGTDFGIVFKYVAKYMSDELPVSIIILTDGFAPFPPVSVSMGIPVIWLLNNTEVDPPWGKVARILV